MNYKNKKHFARKPEPLTLDDDDQNYTRITLTKDEIERMAFYQEHMFWYGMLMPLALALTFLVFVVINLVNDEKLRRGFFKMLTDLFSMIF